MTGRSHLSLQPVSPSGERVRQDALHPDETQRASVADALIESLQPDRGPGADEAWERVIEHRVRELEAGTAQTVPWSEVRARLFSGFE